MRCQRQPRQRQPRQRTGMRARLLACAATCAIAAGIFFPLLLGGSSGGAVALACGLGNGPTLTANSDPALLFPVTKNQPASQPVGLFATTYVAGQPISFNDDLSHVVGAPDPSSLKWQWDFGDGSPTSSEIAPQHTYAKPGTYNIHVQIFDPTTNGLTPFDSAQITVIAAAQPNPPTAQITASTSTVKPGGSITFDAGNSHAADGSKLTYLWNFNDGTTATGPHVTHTFAITGYGIVALIVTDAHGARAVATTNIAVLSTYPVAKVSASALSVIPGGNISFNASKSAAPQDLPGDHIVKYVWDFGDGSAKTTTSGPTTSHRFIKPGNYSVTIQAFDVVGISGTTRLTIAVGFSPLMIGGAIAAVLLLWGVGYLIVSSRRRASLARARAARDAERELARSHRVGPARPGQSAAGRPRGAGAPPPPRSDRRRLPPDDDYRDSPRPGATGRYPQQRGQGATGRYPQQGSPAPTPRSRQSYDEDGEWGASGPRRRPPDRW